uniref:Uncharacterized protein n=1 Tax=Romanomermis culicivorax TaxID=13658 RepID=A0A915IWV5_ROMCU
MKSLEIPTALIKPEPCYWKFVDKFLPLEAVQFSSLLIKRTPRIIKTELCVYDLIDDGVERQLQINRRSQPKIKMASEESVTIPSSSSYNMNNPKCIFVCGFLKSRLHNKQLSCLTKNLMNKFFVCSNNSNSNSCEKSNDSQQIRLLLKNSSCLIFYLNRFTIKDQNCVHILKLSYDFGVPVIMIRHPTTSLKIDVAKKQRKLSKKCSRNNRQVVDKNHQQLSVFQEQILQSYQNSVEYVKDNHNAAMKDLIEKIHGIYYHRRIRGILAEKDLYDLRMKEKFYFHFFNRSNATQATVLTDQIKTAGSSTSNSESSSGGKRKPKSDRLKLPIISSSGVTLKCQARNSRNNSPKSNYFYDRDMIIRLRSKSTGNLIIERMKMQHRHQNSLNNYSNGEEEEDSKNSTFSGENYYFRRNSAISSTNDKSLYNETQYLIFHHSSSRLRALDDMGPRLIRFPSEIVVKSTECASSETGDLLSTENDSLWGSETSLEIEADDIAPKIKGDWEIETPPRTPGPFLGPL